MCVRKRKKTCLQTHLVEDEAHCVVEDPHPGVGGGDGN